MRQAGIFLLIGLAALSSCQSARQTNATKPGAKKMEIKLTSPAFKEGEIIPKKYTCDGDDISPPLAWEAVPNGAKSLALIADDPDAPKGTWVHWVIFNLPATAKELPEHLSISEMLNGAKQGMNDFGKIGYGGPCPPAGNPHRYFFKLYALDSALHLKPNAKKEDLVNAMEGHILGQGQLMGKYARK